MATGCQGDGHCNDHDHAQNRDEDDVGWNDENDGANDVLMIFL